MRKRFGPCWRGFSLWHWTMIMWCPKDGVLRRVCSNCKKEFT